MSEEPESGTIAEAQRAAEAWLAHIERSDAESSLRESAHLFRSSLDLDGWRTALERAQGMLGRPVSRALKEARYATELPGAPDGEYVVLKYDTRFERREHGMETVVPMRDPDGEWRVSGYFVR